MIHAEAFLVPVIVFILVWVTAFLRNSDVFELK